MEEAEESLRDFQQQLETVFKETRDALGAQPARSGPPASEPEPVVATAVDAATWSSGSARRTCSLPEGFTPHKRVHRSC